MISSDAGIATTPRSRISITISINPRNVVRLPALETILVNCFLTKYRAPIVAAFCSLVTVLA